MCFKLQQCCCGCTLQTGTKIIGWLTLLAGISRTILDAISLSFSTTTTPFELVNTPVGFSAPIDSIIGIVISVAWIAVAILVLIAAYKNRRPGLLLPWLICIIISVLRSIASGIFLCVVSALTSNIVIGIVAVVTILIGVALGIYFGSVVNSYRNQLKDMETLQKNNYEIPALNSNV